MRSILYFCALFVAAVEATPLPPARAQALLEQFRSRQQQTKTWSASFTQTLSLPGLQQKVVSRGTLIYREPGGVRLDFTRPAGDYVLVVDDRIFLHKTGQGVEVKSLSDDYAGKPFQWLLGMLGGQSNEEETLYDLALSIEGDKYVLALNRKSDAPDQLPKFIKNTIEAGSLEIREVFVELPNGGTLSYDFESVARNRAIDRARFVPPDSP